MALTQNRIGNDITFPILSKRLFLFWVSVAVISVKIKLQYDLILTLMTATKCSSLYHPHCLATALTLEQSTSRRWIDEIYSAHLLTQG